jgi:hypothetical protein
VLKDFLKMLMLAGLGLAVGKLSYDAAGKYGLIGPTTTR